MTTPQPPTGEHQTPPVDTEALFARAQDAVEDVEAINLALIDAGRDDLVMAQRVDNLEDWNGEPIDMNNFLPFLIATMPALDDPDRYKAIAGTSLELVKRPDFRENFSLYIASHLNKPAFARMWVLFPELTDALVRDCVKDKDELATTEERYQALAPERAYTIMRRLVGAADHADLGDTFEIDPQYLTR